MLSGTASDVKDLKQYSGEGLKKSTLCSN